MVTVAIPAYKAKYLAEAVQSVLDQTYKNFELIIVNDHSPEPVDEVVCQFNDSRIRYYINENNLGKESIVHNWNKCLSYAQGEFFALLCDDDVLKPTFLEELLGLADKYPKCKVFRSPTEYFDSTGAIIYKTDLWPEYESGESFIKASLQGYRKHTISEFLYRTSYIQEKGGYIVFPAGWCSDGASLMSFAFEDGIGSISDYCLKFRKSDQNISYSDKYNFSKAVAITQYFVWLDGFLETAKIPNPLNIGNELECNLFACLKPCSRIQKIRAILKVPSKYFSLSRRLKLISSILSHQ